MGDDIALDTAAIGTTLFLVGLSEAAEVTDFSPIAGEIDEAVLVGSGGVVMANSLAGKDVAETTAEILPP